MGKLTWTMDISMVHGPREGSFYIIQETKLFFTRSRDWFFPEKAKICWFSGPYSPRVGCEFGTSAFGWWKTKNWSHLSAPFHVRFEFTIGTIQWKKWSKIFWRKFQRPKNGRNKFFVRSQKTSLETGRARFDSRNHSSRQFAGNLSGGLYRRRRFAEAGQPMPVKFLRFF